MSTPTGIDHSLPYTAVVMVRENGENARSYPLPAGYHYAAFTPEDEAQWVQLQAEVTHVESLEQGRELFRQEFLQAGADVPCAECPGYRDVVERTILVKTEDNRLVGAATLWMGDTFGETWQRVHWVAVHPAHQGKGLAKCMLSRMLQLYEELGCKAPIYLTTQTRTYRAARVYAQMGFAPYMGEKPRNWPFRSDLPKGSFREENEAAWELIRQKLTQAGLRIP